MQETLMQTTNVIDEVTDGDSISEWFRHIESGENLSVFDQAVKRHLETLLLRRSVAPVEHLIDVNTTVRVLQDGKFAYIVQSKSMPEFLKALSAKLISSYSGHKSATAVEVQSDETLRPAITDREGLDSMLVTIKRETFYSNPDEMECVIGLAIPNSEFVEGTKLEVDDFMTSEDGKTITQHVQETEPNAKVACLGPLAIDKPGSFFEPEILKSLVDMFTEVDEIAKKSGITHFTLIGREGLIRMLNMFGFTFEKAEEYHLNYAGELPDGVKTNDVFEAYSNYWLRDPKPSLYVASYESLSKALAAFKVGEA